MGAVTPERRGIAAGTRTMMNNAGMVVSIAFGLAVTASSMSPEAMQGLFAGTQVGTHGFVTNKFIAGLHRHRTFLISFVTSVVVALVSLMRGPINLVTNRAGDGNDLFFLGSRWLGNWVNPSIKFVCPFYNKKLE